MIDQLFQYIGQIIIYGGGAVGVAYAVFRTLSVKWLDSKFAESLAAYKHAQAKEIEEVRFRINSLFDRLTKLHQNELEVLPEAWARLYDAYWKAELYLALMQSYPDLDRMSEAHRNEFIESCELHEWQKEEVRQASDKNECYRNHIRWHELAGAQDASIECHTYLRTNGIFLKQEMQEHFSRIDDLVWKALMDQKSILKYGPGPVPPDKVTRFEEAKPLMTELEVNVRNKLH